MEFNNHTPFAGIAWENVNAKNEWSVSTVARVKFKLKPTSKSGELELSFDEDQGELFSSDQFYADASDSSVRYESDYISFKQNTDVIINANAISPNSKAKHAYECAVRVYAKDKKLLKEHALKVTGQKKYSKVAFIWLGSLREKTSSVPIRYENAYGGTIVIRAKDETKEDKYLKVNPYNPIGCGIKKRRDPHKTACTPQVGYLKKAKRKAPAGFGFINRAWKSRLPYAGTYDEKWIDEQHPLPPHDFDSFYNQAAHPQLIMDGYLQGGSIVELENLREGEETQYFILPTLKLMSRTRTHTGDLYKEMNLDTLIIDLDDEDANKHALYASYRSVTPRTQEVKSTDLALTKESL